MRIVLGLLGCVLSILIIIYRFQIRSFIGQVSWAENKFGPGGTYTLLALVGVFCFIFSLMYMTNSFDFILSGMGFNFFSSVK
jgi:hypothetical protein